MENPKAWVMTSVKLSEEDHKFVTNNQLQFSELLREAINNRRNVVEGHILNNIEEEKRKRERFQEIFEKSKKFLNDKGLLNEFLEDL